MDMVPLLILYTMQSELLVVKKKNRRYCPIYFRKVGLNLFPFSTLDTNIVLTRLLVMCLIQEDIEKELSMVSRASRGSGISQHIMVAI